MKESKYLEYVSIQDQIYGILKLKNYPYEKNIKCFLNGKEIAFLKLTSLRNVLFSYEFTKENIDKKILIEYEVDETPINLYICNTAEGLNAYITDLEKLENILLLRQIARRKNISLNSFVLFGTLLINNLGELYSLSYSKDLYFKFSNKIVSLLYFKTNVLSYSYSLCNIPKKEDICFHCGQGWTLENILDFDLTNNYIYHKDCYIYHCYEKTKLKFKNIVEKALDENVTLKGIRNECGSYYKDPWFIIKTKNGDIKLGLRKNEIEINWLTNYKKFSYNGEKEKVTKCFNDCKRYIYANDEQKAIEYLKAALYTIL